MQTKCHLSVLIHEQARKYGSRTALTFRLFGKNTWESVSWEHFSQRVKQVSNALLELGVRPQDNLAVFSQNCVEYLYTDFGAYGVMAVTIPFYATSSEQQIQFMINDAQVRFVFVGEQEQYNKAHRIFALCPSLERIIIYDRSVRISSHDPHALYFDDFVALGAGLPRQAEVEALWLAASDDDLCNILIPVAPQETARACSSRTVSMPPRLLPTTSACLLRIRTGSSISCRSRMCSSADGHTCVSLRALSSS